MGRNDYTKTMLMFLCFGTAFVSMAMHWHSQSAMQRSLTSDSRYSRQAPQTSPKATSHKKSAPILIKSDSQQSQPTNWWSRLIDIEQPSQATPNRGLIQPQIQNQSPHQTPTANPTNKPQQTKVVVDLSDRRVYVYRQDQVIASYPTGIGKKGWETPTGKYQVIHMEHDPTWKHPITGKIYPAGRPDSPLGARWIGFHSTQDGEIGFHGTPDEMLVGASISHGCLRMRNQDVKMLYDQVQLGTPVEVR